MEKILIPVGRVWNSFDFFFFCWHRQTEALCPHCWYDSSSVWFNVLKQPYGDTKLKEQLTDKGQLCHYLANHMQFQTHMLLFFHMKHKGETFSKNVP